MGQKQIFTFEPEEKSEYDHLTSSQINSEIFFNKYLSIALIIEVEISSMHYQNKIKSKLNKEKTSQ